MPTKVTVSRTDHTPEYLRELASKNKFHECRRRLRATALVNEGELSRAEIAKGVGVDAGQGADRDGRVVAGSRTRRRQAFALDGRRQMLRIGFRQVSPRPLHPKADPEAQEEFRNGLAQLAEMAVPGGVSTEDELVKFQDEARKRQIGMLSRIWAQKGTHPRNVRDHRYGCVYLFSTACPETRTPLGHDCAKADTGEANRHLREFKEQVPAGKHALGVRGAAGWHRSRELEISTNVSLLRLPPCPVRN